MEQDYNKKLYIGKFISFFIQNPKNTTKLRNDKKYSIKIREAPSKDQSQKTQQKLYIVSQGVNVEKNQPSILCKLKKGQEIIYKKYICHGNICHIFDEMWIYLLNAGYIKLKAKFLNNYGQMIDQFGVVEIEVHLNESAIIDDYELKIWEPKKPKQQQTLQEKKEIFQKNQQSQQKAENLRFARISLLLMLDFMNIVIEQPALIKSDKQIQIFFAQYQKIFETEMKLDEHKEVLQQLKSYPRYIIEDEKYFKTYISNKNLHNRLFKKEQIISMALIQRNSIYYSGNKIFSPIYKTIHPILHLQFQRIVTTFYNQIIKFLNNNMSQVNKAKREDFAEDFLKNVFLSKYNSTERFHESDAIDKKLLQFIKTRGVLESLVGMSLKVPCLADENLDLYTESNNGILDLLLVEQVIKGESQNDQNKQTLQEIYYQNTKNKIKAKEINEQDDFNLVDFSEQNDLNEVFTQKKVKQLEIKDKPALMQTELKQHQKEALFWMLGREKQLEKKQQQQQLQLSPFWAQIKLLKGEEFFVNMFTGKFQKEFVPMKEVKGGILADEMGLGKTLMALALILETQKKGNQTLIVVPKSVLLQWQKEIKLHSKPNSLNVLVYYKKRDRELPIKNYDVILTTYTILGQQYQQWQKVNTDKNQKNQIKDQVEFIEFDMISNEVEQLEISSEVEEKNQPNREDDDDNDDDDSEADDSDIDFSDSSDFVIKEEKKSQRQKKQFKQKKNSQNLFNYSYYRVILDEAHNVKNRQTVQSKGATALEAEYRWCLTGTPIQNKHDDLFGLVSFLRVETFSDYFWWNTYINKEQNEDEQQKILQQILKPLILRRTKNDYQFEGMQKIQEQICWVDLQENEKVLYNKFHEGSKLFFKNYYEENAQQKSYIHIFEILNKLRMACDHPALALKDINLNNNPLELMVKKIENFFKQKSQEGVELQEYKKAQIESIRNGEITECQICTNDNIETYSLSSCGHIYCKSCFTSEISQRASCPACRKKITLNDLLEVKVDNYEIFHEVKGYQMIEMSSKLSAVLKQAQDLIHKKQKILIFTQWISMIGFLEKMFTENKISTLKITGSMTTDKREKIISSFKQSNDSMILLLSLRATATGLNLTMANNVFIVDPWWNPSIEDQAIGRADRIGQKSQVNVYRFICRDTIEQKINLLHQKKKIQFTKVLNADQKKEKDFEDLKFLLLN